jgi:hypothetical protein
MCIRSPDGQLLMVSSSDGFCSIISFTKEELGVIYKDNTHIKSEPMEIVESVIQEDTEVKELPNIIIPLQIEQKEEKQITDRSEAPTKKRVQLVTLSSPKNNKYINK